MSQLGSGNNSSYRDGIIDTRQTFINSPTAGPDSSSRLDSEVVNDGLDAIVGIETILGARPQGNFGSLAARLQQFLPGGGSTPLFFGFTNASTFEVLGSTHNLGTAAPLVQVYDANTPRGAIEPSAVTIDPLTYTVGLTFATPQSGAVSLASPSPQYTTTFTNQTTVTILGTTHALGTADLLIRVYTVAGGLNVLTHAAVTVAAGTFTVVVTFATAQSGSIILSNAGPRYVTNFTSQTTVTIPGATHALATPALLFQVYDANSPRAIIRPNTFTVDPATFDVTLTFVTAQSGRVLLVRTSEVTGTDFEVRDAGVTNASAVRVFSQAGLLKLQMGSGDAAQILNKTGTVVQSTSTAGNLVITGTATKPGGGAWLSPSDRRLKDQITSFEDGLAQVQQLRPVWFVYNGAGGIADRQRHSGFIAQDVQPVAPYMVGTTTAKLHSRDAEPTELLTFDGEALIPLLVNALQELTAVVETLQHRLAALEASRRLQEPHA